MQIQLVCAQHTSVKTVEQIGFEVLNRRTAALFSESVG